MTKPQTTPKTAEAHNIEAGVGSHSFVSTPNVPSATWDQILHPPERRLRDLLSLTRIKCTRRFQASDYVREGATGYKEAGDVAVDATSHLREILALVEEAEKLV
jgi:hypothetical protein